MSDIIQRQEYFAIEVADKPGEGARILNGLKQAGVSLKAFTGFPSGRKVQIDLVVDDAAALKAAVKGMKLKLGAKKNCFVIQGEDRVGALIDALDKLAEAKINVTACDAVTAGMGRYGAILWVKPRDMNKAAKLLGAGTAPSTNS